MHTGKGQVNELILRDGIRHARISCPANLVPLPGQYLIVGDGSDAVLPVPVFYTDSAPDGFVAASVPTAWIPGLTLHLRGPFGRGFNLPTSARKVCLAAFDEAPVRLRGLVSPVLKQGAALALVTDTPVDNLPDDVEVHPPGSLGEILSWADYAAFDVARERLPNLLGMLKEQSQLSTWKEAEALVRTPIPCGGIGECGVCAVVSPSGWKMACKEGPVFTLGEL